MGTLDRGGVESLVLRYAKIKKIIVHSHNTKDWRKTSILQSLCGPVLCKLSIPAACSSDVGRILRTFKIKKNVEVTDNGKDNF